MRTSQNLKVKVFIKVADIFKHVCKDAHTKHAATESL